MTRTKRDGRNEPEKEVVKRIARFDRKPYNNKYLMSVAAHGLGERISFFSFSSLSSLHAGGTYLPIRIYIVKISYTVSGYDVELPIRKKVNINSFSRKSVKFERPNRK